MGSIGSYLPTHWLEELVLGVAFGIISLLENWHVGATHSIPIALHTMVGATRSILIYFPL